MSIDTLLISSRHLYRSPYSLNEKSGLVSIPIDPTKILEFDKSQAEPNKIQVSKFKFLDRSSIIKGEANKLIVSSFDFKPRTEEEFIREKKEYIAPEEAISEKLFPPCVNIILKGLKDGRKRSMFILINFLNSCGWSYDQIEAKLHEWNKLNDEPLKEVLIVGQIRYHKQQKKKILPPNCPKRMNNIPEANQQNYYSDLHICNPDNLCARIKNPVQYTRRKVGKQK